MNSRNLNCKESKNVLAIGEEGSISDLKEKIKKCFDCYAFIDCKMAQGILKNLIKQQDNFHNYKQYTLKKEFKK